MQLQELHSHWLGCRRIKLSPYSGFYNLEIRWWSKPLAVTWLVKHIKMIDNLFVCSMDFWKWRMYYLSQWSNSLCFSDKPIEFVSKKSRNLPIRSIGYLLTISVNATEERQRPVYLHLRIHYLCPIDVAPPTETMTRAQVWDCRLGGGQGSVRH